MKKLVLAFGFLTFLLVTPSVSAAVDFSVLNVSQDNVDATQSGVRAGDVLRYEIVFDGGEMPEMAIDLSDVLAGARMVNAGGGILNGTILAFPESLCLTTCEGQTFSFFVRANQDCEEGAVLDVAFGEQSLSVPLHCALAKSGPGALIIAILALMLIVGYALLSPRKEAF